MKLSVCGEEIFVSTGGRPFDPRPAGAGLDVSEQVGAVNDTPAGQVLLFIHGSGQNHLSWILQGRFLANRGFTILAPDLPGHGYSTGAPLGSIEAMADWCVSLLDACGVTTATVIGHSQGGLVAMEMAARYPQQVERLVLIATALAIPVNDGLLGLARNDQPRAIEAMVSWGHGVTGHRHDATLPGQSHLNFGRQLMAGNDKTALFTDLNACNTYENGPAAASAITCPTCCILAGRDRMTPLKTGRAMADAIDGARLEIIANGGHMLPSETPDETNAALRRFLGSPTGLANP